MNIFQKAVKEQCKIRMAIYGASGSGKTFTSLSIATGLGKRVALIDTEHGSAAKYADMFDFDNCNASEQGPESLIKLIKAAHGYDVLIIDSLSHSWQQLLTEVDNLAATKYQGNSFRAWSEGTPLQRKLVEAILKYPGHVIGTMRAKTEYVVEQNSKGKAAPRRVGLAPEQGKGIEYEFDIIGSISPDNIMHIEKSRAFEFSNKTYAKPGKELGEALAKWANSGAEKPKATDEQITRLNELLEVTGKELPAGKDIEQFDPETASKAIKYYESILQKMDLQPAQSG
jgi:hypothetical protein